MKLDGSRNNVGTRLVSWHVWLRLLPDIKFSTYVDKKVKIATHPQSLDRRLMSFNVVFVFLII